MSPLWSILNTTHRITHLIRKTIFPWNYSKKNLTLSPPVDVHGIQTTPSASVTSALRLIYISSTRCGYISTGSTRKRRSVCFCVRLLMECITKFKKETGQKYKTFISNLPKTNRKARRSTFCWQKNVWIWHDCRKKYKPIQSLFVKNPLIIEHLIWQTVDKLPLIFASSFHVISFFKYFKMFWSKFNWAQEYVE